MKINFTDFSNTNIKGSSIVINNNRVFINGKEIKNLNDYTDKEITLVIQGDVENVDVSGNLECQNINGDVDCSGSIHYGDIKGDVDCSGTINCGYIGGDIDCSGNIRIQK